MSKSTLPEREILAFGLSFGVDQALSLICKKKTV